MLGHRASYRSRWVAGTEPLTPSHSRGKGNNRLKSKFVNGFYCAKLDQQQDVVNCFQRPGANQRPSK